jgi:arylsulfatase A-like enzyme/Tfp pilus assembly protein PilF
VNGGSILRYSILGIAACGTLACGGSGDAGSIDATRGADAGGVTAGTTAPGDTASGEAAPGSVRPSEAVLAASESLGAGPNLLLVTLDTLRADHIGAYGYAGAETPVLDRLAAEGIRFDQVASTAPITLVAHGSIMTGQIPPNHGLRDNGNFLAEDATSTLAEVLDDAGYATGGFVASFVLDRRFGLARGFDAYTDFRGLDPEVGLELLLNVERRGDEVVDDAIAWLGEQSGPFFAWVHLFDPHTPYEPPEPFASRHPGRPYDGEIAYTDQQLGRLLRYLEESGRAGDTLLIVTADHGEGLGDHQEKWHGFFVYDSTIRVPLIVRGEGLPAGLVVEGQASLVDLLPTTLALLDVEDPDRSSRDGRDLRPLIVDPAAAGRAAYAESLVPLFNFGWSELRALRVDGYKYISAPRPELYDLGADPGERHDLAERDPDRTAELAAALDAMVAGDDALEVAEGHVAADPETIERLRSLGYLSGSVRPAAGRRDVDPKDRIVAYEAFVEGYEEATEAVRGGRWAAAERQLRELDQAVPDQFLIQHYLGRAALGRGDPAAAIELLERSLTLSPSFYSPTFVELARAYAQSGQPQRAIELLADAVGLYPDNFAIRFNLGYHLQAAGRLDEALAAYLRAAELVPGYPQLLTNIAAIHLARGEPQEALDALREALDANPDDGRAWGNVGMILGGTGRFGEAEQAFRRAVALLPNEAPLHFNLGLALMRQGKNAEAIAALRRALELDPDMEPARAALRALGGG